jgi:lysophospholipase L1-like esterase
VIALLCAAALIAGLCVFTSWIKDRRKKADWDRQVQEYLNAKLAVYTAENEKYADYEVDVAFLGDSLTDGYPLEAFYPQYKVTNRGIGGDTTFTLQNRLQTSVLDLKPKIIVMLIGGNNPQTMFDNYENILMGLKNNLPNTKIVLLSLTSMSQDWGKHNHIAAYNNVKIQKLAQQYGFAFVDLYSPLMDLSTGELCAQYTTDGAHLTDRGYQVLTAQITPVLETLVPLEK